MKKKPAVGIKLTIDEKAFRQECERRDREMAQSWKQAMPIAKMMFPEVSDAEWKNLTNLLNQKSK